MPSCPSSPEPLHRMRRRAISSAAAPPRRRREEKRSSPRARARERERRERGRERERESARTTRGPRWRGAGPPWLRWEWRRSVSAGAGSKASSRRTRVRCCGGWRWVSVRRAGQALSPPRACVRGFCAWPGRVAVPWFGLLCRVRDLCRKGKGWVWRQWAGLSFWASVRSGPVRCGVTCGSGFLCSAQQVFHFLFLFFFGSWRGIHRSIHVFSFKKNIVPEILLQSYYLGFKL